MKIDRALEPGLLESVYEPVLARVFANRGLTVERQKVIRFEYDGKIFDEGLRVDLLVEHDRYRQTEVLRFTGSSSP
jgi:GxxExxY protein